MISASSGFLEQVNNGVIPLMRMQLTTASGRVIWLDDGQFWSSGVSFSEATSQDGTFSVGSAVIGSFSFTLNNFDRSLDGIEFAGAVVIPFVYLEVDGTNEYVPKGVFYISKHVTSGNVIKCTALDGLKLMDQSQTSITYPITVQSLVETLCNANGITLATTTIPNGSFSLNIETDENGTIEVMTDRQMLSYACQCIGCFAKMNEDGELEVKWYDFDNPVNLATTFDGKSLWTSPIMVTGLKVDIGDGSGTLMAMSIDAYGNVIYVRPSTVADTFTINSSGQLVATVSSGATYTIVSEELVRTGDAITASTDDETNVSIIYGTDDRVIKIEGNPYITADNVVTVCENISNNIFAIAFRPGTLPLLSNPCLQSGDVLSVTDNITGTNYLFPVTSTIYNKGIMQNAICAFEDKEDADLRPSSSYSMRVSVANAMAQAKAADLAAQVAQEYAIASGYQAVIRCDKGNAFVTDSSATLTGIIYDKDLNEVDADGTEYVYRWWVAQDSNDSRYLDGGKEIDIYVADPLCEYTAGIYFEVIDIENSVYPFALCDRASAVLTTRSGVMLTARGAESVTT